MEEYTLAVVEVKNLTKRYGKHTAVEGLSFSVESGQIYGFLGPNGAGKSTTMNIMTGYLASSGGEVLINGHDMMREPEEAKKCIGYLPEVPPVYPDMTVREYLQFAAELKGILKKERKQQIAEVMELTKVTEVSERLIKNLSKGYRQRVGLAQAILGEPDVIILDEPMVGLDPRQIIEMRDLIRALGKKHTVILSSHILSEVSAVCDHIMIISDGRLVASDSPEGLQRLIQGSSSLEAVVKATIQQIREVIDTIEAVAGMEEKPSHMPDCVMVSIRTKDNADIREELSMKLYERKLPIMGMSMQEHSLEDIFLELTERQEEDAKADNKEEDKHDSDI
ncbi:ABC transporter ATP-binding protein [bacterium 1XD8-76]|nr:ABC transporter ATP-binding protein [bacterium 1XD8-76]